MNTQEIKPADIGVICQLCNLDEQKIATKMNDFKTQYRDLENKIEISDLLNEPTQHLKKKEIRKRRPW